MLKDRRVVIMCTLVVVLGLPRAATALCFPSLTEPQLDSPASYVGALVSALSYAKEAEGRANEQMSEVEIVTGLRRAKGDYECALQAVRPYVESASDFIRASATAADYAFSSLTELQDVKASFMVSVLDTFSDGTYRAGETADTASRLAIATEEAGQILMTAALMATFALVEEEPGTDVLSRLAVTAAERDDLKARLVSAFGSSVTQGLVAGQSRLVAAAATIVKVLDQPRPTRAQP